jgi:hypothetical protein
MEGGGMVLQSRAKNFSTMTSVNISRTILLYKIMVNIQGIIDTF